MKYTGTTMLRTIFYSVFNVTISILGWKLAQKYWHISNEVPKMYHGVISHMEVSRRWNCINAIFYIGVIVINTCDGYYTYYFLLCQMCNDQLPENKCCWHAFNNEFWCLFNQVLASTVATLIPCLLLFSALRKMKVSQETLLNSQGVCLHPHMN